jgi:hypothetical protein
MKYEGCVISEGGGEGWSQSVQFALGFKKVMRHFEEILF